MASLTKEFQGIDEGRAWLQCQNLKAGQHIKVVISEAREGSTSACQAVLALAEVLLLPTIRVTLFGVCLPAGEHLPVQFRIVG